MKAFLSSLLHWLAVIGCAAAQDAYIYNLDVQPPAASSSKPSSIDSDTANAILARRLGATESRKLGLVDDVILAHLNHYGGQRTVLPFADESASSMSDRMMILIEGYEGGEPYPAPDIRIERADTNLASNSYMKDLIERGSIEKDSCTAYVTLKSGVHVTYMADPKGGPCMAKDELMKMFGGDTNEPANRSPQATQEALNAKMGSASTVFVKLDMTRINEKSQLRNKAANEAFNNWYKVLEALAKAGKMESTIVVLPSHRAPPTLNLNRRQIPEDENEEPLSQPVVSVSSSDSSSPHETAQSPTSNTTHPPPPPRALLPACFAENTTCNDRTNACSGHGFCYAKSSKCFACKCGSTVVRQDSDGKNIKTVQWGGTACERKDVSVPFFLFAGFGVFMSALVVGSIGMLYSMGSEELPSVIGAGVTGPRAQR